MGAEFPLACLATSQFNAVRTAQRVFNWAVKEKLLSQNPIKGMARPRQQSRDSYVSDEEFRALLRAAASAFRLFLFLLRQTGARPSEVRELTWDRVHEDRWVLSKHKTVDKTRKPRVIHLTRLKARSDRPWKLLWQQLDAGTGICSRHALSSGKTACTKPTRRKK